MSYATIRKTEIVGGIPPNMAVYEREPPAEFWSHARAELEGLPGGGLNIAHEAVDRHAAGDRAGVAALRCIASDGGSLDISYAELAALTNRFANALSSAGLERGDVVCSIAGRLPMLYVAALGTLKLGGVYCPLFSAFGPEPLRRRLAIARARVVVTTRRIYEQKLRGLRPSLPDLEHVVLIGNPDQTSGVEGTLDWHVLMADASDARPAVRTDPEDVALLHFTSGTTGMPKGAVHVHEAVVAHRITGRLVLDLRPGDVYWCTADPGWVTGTSYGIIAPLANGVTNIVDEGEFDPARWYQTLERESVAVWYTAPTAIRMLMKAGSELVSEHRFPALRFLASVGEPLNPEAVVWGSQAFGMPFHDNWWQTETGGIMIANFRSTEVRPGSMGRPIPGVEAAVVRRTGESRVTAVDEPGVEGELALRKGWPSMFRGYLGEPERYRRCFADGWYLTGDLVCRDEDGFYWFVGRADDVIKTSGHLIGPFEVESVLMEHPAVAEAGVIGTPDPVAGEVVKAFVVLKDGFEASDSLRRELLALGRTRLGAVVAPKEVRFVGSVPKTRSGKIMRRLLKARELGLPEGDVSTVEESR